MRSLIKFPLNRDVVFALFLALISVFVYFQSLSNDFQLQWDDQVILMNHYTEDGLHISNLKAIASDFFRGQYAPVNQFFYTLLFSEFGYDAFYFHLASLTVHMLNVLLTYLLIVRLLALAKFDQRNARTVALITATLLAIHPLTVESVAWVSASKIVLYGFFYLLALHAYIKYLQARKIQYYVLTVILFVISFGAKEQAVTLPLCLLLIDHAAKRDFKSADLWLEKAPMLALSIFFGVITMFSQSDNNLGVLSQAGQYPFYQRVIFACYSFWEYVAKCIIPVNLLHVYPFPNPIGKPVTAWMWIYPIATPVVLYCTWKTVVNRWLRFGLLFFVIHIALVLNFMPLARFSIVADRYCYLSSIGIFFVMAWLFNGWLTSKKRTTQALSIGILYMLMLASYSIIRVSAWKDSQSLKADLRNMIKARNHQTN